MFSFWWRIQIIKICSDPAVELMSEIVPTAFLSSLLLFLLWKLSVWWIISIFFSSSVFPSLHLSESNWKSPFHLMHTCCFSTFSRYFPRSPSHIFSSRRMFSEIKLHSKFSEIKHFYKKFFTERQWRFSFVGFTSMYFDVFIWLSDENLLFV